ncbi:MAG: hypothetical protein GY759_08535 [Chloroflexi bacterium]|nr:hypothetical protein [Chloroflexota bacterium]
MNEIERETIILNAVCHLIDDMLNRSMLVEEWSSDWSNIMFRTDAHARLFNILLGDFLSIPNPKKGGALPFGLPPPPTDGNGSNRTYLHFLKTVSDDPQLGPASYQLTDAVYAFASWLEGNTFIEKVWFSSMDLELDMTVQRIKALKMTGDIGKHNFTRLEGVVKGFQSTMEANGHAKPIEECYLALPEFQDWFYRHAFAYQSSQIAEFLSSIIWEIHLYLKPEYDRSTKFWFDEKMKIQMYKFETPTGLNDTFAKAMHWDLMNMVQRGPFLPRFIAGANMKTELR